MSLCADAAPADVDCMFIASLVVNTDVLRTAGVVANLAFILLTHRLLFVIVVLVHELAVLLAGGSPVGLLHCRVRPVSQ